MRLYYLGVLLLAALASCQKMPSSYSAERDYIYSYKSHIITGMPRVSNEYIGFRLNAEVIVTHAGDKQFQLRLQNAELTKAKGDITPYEPYNPDFKLSKKNDKKLENDDLAKKELILPISFKWAETGLIYDIRTHSEDTVTSTNLKKAILTMLSAYFEGIEPKEGMGFFDRKHDDSIDGSCAAAYTSEHLEEDLFRLVRVRGVDTCKKTPTFLHSLFPSVPCENPFSKKKDGINWVQSNTETEYMVTRNDDDFFIESATTTSQYGVTPPEERSQKMVTFVDQKLRYLRHADPTPSMANFDRHRRGLRMVLPLSVREIKDSQPKLVAKAKKYLKKLGKSPRINGRKVNNREIKLVRTLRLLSAGDINGIFKALKKKSLERTFFMDMLSSCGTDAALKVIVQLAKGKQVSDSEAAQLIRIATIASPASMQLINSLMDLTDTLSPKTHMQSLRASLLSTGSGFNKILRSPHIPPIHRTIVKFYKDQSKRKIEGMNKEEQDSLILMSIGNSGDPNMLKHIADKLKRTKRNTVSIRLQAIRALRKISFVAPSKVRQLLFPILADFVEDNELRINAYRGLTMTMPNRFHMAVLANLLREEPSRHVLSFITSHIKLLAKQENPSLCNMRMVKNAKWLVRMLPKNLFTRKMWHSRTFYYPLPGGPKIGIYGAIIYSQNAPSPRSVMIGLMGSIKGNFVPFVEMTIRSMELHYILRALGGPDAALMKVLTGKAPLNAILGKIMKSAKRGGRTDISTAAYYSLFGDDVYVYSSDARRKASWLRGKLPGEAGQLMAKLMGSKGAMLPAVNIDRSLFFDAVFASATTFGFPIHFNQTFSTNENIALKVGMAGSMEKPMMKMNTNMGCTLRFKASYGVDATVAQTSVSADVGISQFPGKQQELQMTLSMGKTKQGGEATMHINRPDLPMTVMEGDVDLNMEYKDEKKSWKKPIKPFGRENITTTYKRKTLSNYGMELTVIRTRSAKMLKDESNPTRRSLLSTPASTKIVMEKTKSSDKRGLAFKFRFSTVNTASMKENIVLKDFPKPEKKPNVVKLMDLPEDKGLKEPDLASLYAPPKLYSVTVKMGMSFLMCNMKVRNNKIVLENEENVYDVEVAMEGNLAFQIDIKTPKISWTIYGAGGSKGAPARYNPNNPFSVTTNYGRLYMAKLIDNKDNKEIATFSFEKSISNWWITTWTKLLQNPSQIARYWPEVYRCVLDMKGRGGSANAMPDSPDCFYAWYVINGLTEVTLKSQMPADIRRMQLKKGFRYRNMISQFLRNFLTTHTIMLPEKDPRSVVIKGEISMFDLENMATHMKVKRMMTTTKYGICELTMHSNLLKVRSFDALTFHTSAKKLRDGKNSLLVAQDYSRGMFTVTANFEGQKPSTVIGLRLMGSTCLITILDKDNINKDGPACKFVQTGFKSQRVAGGITVTAQPLQLSVLTVPGKLVQVRAGLAYHDSTRGVCGNLDQDPNTGEYEVPACPEELVMDDTSQLVNHYTMKKPEMFLNKKISKCKKSWMN